MKIVITQKCVFYPEWNNNLDLPEDERIRVEYKIPTIAVRERIEDRSETKARADSKGNVEGVDIVLKTDDNAIIDAMLTGIYNCSAEVDGKTIEINGAKTLREAPCVFGGLYEEIVAELRKTLKRGINEKNSA